MIPRILFLDQTGQLGGAELSLLDIAQHYRASSKVLLLDNGPFEGLLTDGGVSVEVLSSRTSLTSIRREGGGLAGIKALPELLRLALEIARIARGYDLIYANTQKALMVGALAGRISKVPVLWHARDIMTEEHFSRLHLRLVRMVTDHWVNTIIANSQASAQAMAKLSRRSRHREIAVVFSGIAAPASTDWETSPSLTSEPSTSQKKRGPLRQALGLSDGYLVGSFSRLARWKGQHVLIEALSYLPQYHAVIVGDAMFGEATYAQDLIKLVQEQGLKDRVHFLGFRQDAKRLMSEVDVVVHSSIAPEPFGRVIVEAQLAGRPVVATAAGGALEIIEDGRSGLLVPPGEPLALAKALEKLAVDPMWAADLAHAGQERARKVFSLEATLRGVEAAVERTIQTGITHAVLPEKPP